MEKAGNGPFLNVINFVGFSFPTRFCSAGQGDDVIGCKQIFALHNATLK